MSTVSYSHARFGSVDMIPLLSLTSRAAESYRNKGREKELWQQILEDLQNQRPDLFTPTSPLTQSVLNKPQAYMPTAIVKVPRFSSGGALAASNLYYLNWLKEKQEKEKLEQQQKQQTDCTNLQPIPFPINSLPASMPILPAQGQFPYSQQIRFAGDPLTWSWLGLTALGHGITKAIAWLLNVVKESLASKEDNSYFKNGETFLEIAKGVHQKDQAYYMQKAESAFLKAYSQMDHPLDQGDCIKIASICAKALGKEPETVKHLADKAYKKWEWN